MRSNPQPPALLIGRSQLERSINSLLGLIEGITADRILNRMEVNFLEQWLSDHENVCGSHPYNELVPCLAAAVHSGKLSMEEKSNLTWLCEQLRQTAYFDKTSADMQRLKGMLDGIVANRVITGAELDGLRHWLEDHRELRTCWPYDEVDSLVTEVLRDQKIDAAELRHLQEYFAGFVNEPHDRTIITAPILSSGRFAGLYAVDPEIRFKDSKFCFTGASAHFARPQLAHLVMERGGELVNNVSGLVDYLVVVADGNPAWAFACHGRKIEQAVELRRRGAKLLIIHETDFHDAVASTARCSDLLPC
ncbi:MAG TPA: BRCT domain-containing protein [Povalibacter sp.]|nr:BRCT domain-containing protein [Povalibacter sp.]